jgi:hypothetical protein
MANDAHICCAYDAIAGDGLAGDIVVVVGGHICCTNYAIAGVIVVVVLGVHICCTDAGHEYTHADDGLASAGSNQHTVC